jgi:hypothetical protein
MIETYQYQSNSIRLDQGFETKLVVKRFSVDREFVQLPVSGKHPWMCSVHGNCGMVRTLNPSLKDGTQFVESNNNLLEMT